MWPRSASLSSSSTRWMPVACSWAKEKRSATVVMNCLVTPALTPSQFADSALPRRPDLASPAMPSRSFLTVRQSSMAWSRV